MILCVQPGTGWTWTKSSSGGSWTSILVQVQPVPGWTHKITRSKLPQPRNVFGERVTDYVSGIEWRGRIAVGEFQEFGVSMRLPKQGTFGDHVVFPALQTYANGEVVRWIQKPETPDGSFDDLDEPAPHVLLSSAEEPALVTQSQLDDEVGDARVLALGGVVLAAVALIATLAVGLWRRRPA